MAGTGRPLVSKPSQGNRLRVLLFTVGVDTAKELIFARLGIDSFGPGYMHFSRKCDDEYFKQLTAEKQVTKFSKGFPSKVWMKVRARNEALDCEVYALAACTILNPLMNVLEAKLKKKAEELKGQSQSNEQTESRTVPITRVGRPHRLWRRPNFVTDW